MNAERLGLFDPEPEVEALVLLPHAAMSPLAAIAATVSAGRRARTKARWRRIMVTTFHQPRQTGITFR